MGASPDFDAYAAKYAARAALQSEVLPLNRAALFDLLAAARIHAVVVAFDGSGDSGSIECIDAVDADNKPVELPAATIEFREVSFEGPCVVMEERGAREAIEIMAYDFLEQTHGGWENDDGASGEFTFTVPDRTITLDHNERYISYNTYQHDF